MSDNPQPIHPEEARLVGLAFGGDSDAFGQIVQRYQKPVYNLCWRYTGNRDADDTAQETFVRAFVNRAQFSQDRPVLPWLLTIARRICIDRLRKSKREIPTEDADAKVGSNEPGADDTVSAKQELTILQDALNKLPEGQRESIVLHHMDGLPYKEVAQVMDVPIGTVMTWLHRGRASLKEAVTSSHKAGAASNGGDQ